MDKGNVTNGAFALPGLASQGKKPFGDGIFSRSRARDRDTVSSSGKSTSKEFGLLDDSSSLVDERGLFLPPRTELSLEHLTKTRPRTQGRRSPSPAARRKSWRLEEDQEYPSDSISKSDAVKLTTQTPSYERGKDNSPERAPAYQERNHVPAPNKSKPKYSKTSIESDLSVEQEFGDLPPPLPSSPPPLEPEEDFEDSEVTNLKSGKFPRLPSAFSTESSSMSTKTRRREEAIDVSRSKNTLLKSAENTQENSRSDSKRSNISGESFLKNNRKDLFETALTVHDSQFSSDPALSPLASQSPKYHKGSVELEKSSSTRRRRFKPVAIPDASESNNLPNNDTPQNGEDNLNRTFPRASTSKSLFDSWLESSRERKQAESSITAGYDGVTRFNRHFIPASTQRSEHFISSTPKIIDPHIALDENRKEENAKRELFTSDAPRLKSGMAVEGDKDNLRMRTVAGETTKSQTGSTATSNKHPKSRDQFDSIDIRMLPELDVSSAVGHKPTNTAFSLPDPVHDVLDNQDILGSFHNSGDLSDRDEQDNFAPGFSQLESIPQLTEHERKIKRSSYAGGKDILEEEHLSGNNNISAVEDLQGYNNEGISEPDDENTLIEPPTEFYENDSQEEREPEVYEPPPMFAQLNDQDITTTKNNRLSTLLDEKFLSSSADDNVKTDQCWSLEEMPEGLRPFHHTPLDSWSEDDAVEWLEYIGLGHFAQQFKNHHVDGKTLKTISYPLLEEIGIRSADEREIILSEIYQLSNPNEDDIEQQLQDALQGASEEDRDKVLAVLNALKSPDFNPLVDIPSTASSSPRDSDVGHVASDTASLSSSMTSSEDHTHDIGMPPPPPPPRWPDSPQASSREGVSSAPSGIVRGLGREDVDGKEERVSSGKEKKKKSSKQNKKEKKSKGVGKLIDSLSHSSKLSKLFGPKKLNPTMQYLLQVGPQGILRVWPRALSEETNYCSFMVSMTTSSAQVVKLVLDKYDAIEDPRRFYISEVHLTKGGGHHDLLENECPLLRQCRWPDPEKYRFELRCRDEGAIKMLFDLEGYEEDLDYRRLAVSSLTPCTEALELIVKKFQLPGKTSEYFLVEVSEEDEGDRQIVAENVYPLRLQMAWSEPDHVFRLCRLISGHTAHLSTDDVRSETSSALNDDETDFPSAAGNGVRQEDVTVVQESAELQSRPEQVDSRSENGPTIGGKFQSNVLTAAELEKVGALGHKGVAEFHEQREVLLRREREVQQLEYQNKELLGKLKELEENGRKELEVRDREIERLYARNSELSAKETELEHLREKGKGPESENVRGIGGDESKLVEKIIDLQQRHKQLEVTADEAEEVKRINRELSKKVDEGVISKQELRRVETQKQEMSLKIQDLESRNKELQSSLGEQVASLRKENQDLAARAKDADDMKQNIIRLTAQLRAMDSTKSDSAELRDLREKLKTVKLEKEQIQLKLEDMERESRETKDNSKDAGELEIENITLVEKQDTDVADLKRQVDKLSEEAKKNELYRSKYEELRGVENYLRKQLNNLQSAIHSKDQRIRDYENKLKAMTQLVKDMEAKLEEQEQHRAYLDQLLPILKQRDPSLLHFMNTSLVSKEPTEEWC